MMAAMDLVGNPSSVHAEGRAARSIVESAREQIAQCFSIAPKNLTFVSGGTEAANASIYAAAKALGRDGALAPVVVSATEHPCVLNALRHSSDVCILPVASNGLVDLDELRRILVQSPPTVVAVQEANSETGVHLMTDGVGRLCTEFGARWVCDRVQVAGRSEFTGLNGDVAFISAHKFGGPKGVAAISWNDRIYADAPVAPLIEGGGQEKGRRGGTENVVGIAGMAAALMAGQRSSSSFKAWALVAQTKLEAGIRERAPGVVIIGEGGPRLPNTTCFAVPGVSAELALMAFDLDGIAVSSGSACSSGKVSPSHVLKAMGVPDDLAACAIRVSTGWNTTDDDIARFLTSFAKLCRTCAAPGLSKGR